MNGGGNLAWSDDDVEDPFESISRPSITEILPELEEEEDEGTNIVKGTLSRVKCAQAELPIFSRSLIMLNYVNYDVISSYQKWTKTLIARLLVEGLICPYRLLFSSSSPIQRTRSRLPTLTFFDNPYDGTLSRVKCAQVELPIFSRSLIMLNYVNYDVISSYQKWTGGALLGRILLGRGSPNTCIGKF
eukprot:sb/3471248/